MEVCKAVVLSNELIAKDVYEMRLSASIVSSMQPGQFVNIAIANLTLRRPISIASIEEGQFVIVYKVVGKGTKALSMVKPKEQLDIFGPLGNGFPIDLQYDEIICIGGGVGVPPLYEVCKQFKNQNKKVNVVLGFASKPDIFYVEKFKELGAEVIIATMDGSFGVEGTVLDAIQKHQLQCDVVYACGPQKMLEAVENKYQKGYISFEARMACGMGACMACVCKDKADKQMYYRICKEGPVFAIGKVDYQ